MESLSTEHRAALHEILSHYGQRVGDDGAELNFEDNNRVFHVKQAGGFLRMNVLKFVKICKICGIH